MDLHGVSRPPLPRTTPTPELFDPEQNRVLIVLAMRMVVATVLLIAVALLTGGQNAGVADPSVLYVIVALVFATSLLYTAAHRFSLNPKRLLEAQIASDLLLVMLFVHYTGGPASGFVFLYPVVALSAATLVGPQASMVSAVCAALLYTLDSFLWVRGLTAVASIPNRTEYALALSRNLFGLILVAALGSLLAARVRKTTSQLHAATESAASYAKLTEDIIRSLSSGLLTTDLLGRVQFINEAGARMYQRAADAFLGESISRFLPVENARVAHEEESLKHRGEGPAARADGTSFPVGFTQAPLVSSDGLVMGSLVLFQDLTELHALREKATRADRLAVLGMLSASLAHEIRNPLGAIGGSVEMVRDGALLSDADRRLLAIVLGEVERLGHLVDSMLDYGSAQSPERTVFDIQALLVEVVTLLEQAPSVRGRVRLACRAHEATYCSADATHTKQILWNVLRNAVQFSPDQGSVHTYLETCGPQVCCYVLDEGPGIPQSERESVFEVFYSKKHQGIGIGLAVAKQLALANGGDLRTIDSQAGACFELALPRAAVS